MLLQEIQSRLLSLLGRNGTRKDPLRKTRFAMLAGIPFIHGIHDGLRLTDYQIRTDRDLPQVNIGHHCRNLDYLVVC